MAGMVRAAVEELRDDDEWHVKVEEEDEGRALLLRAAGNWSNIREFLNGNPGDDAGEGA